MHYDVRIQLRDLDRSVDVQVETVFIFESISNEPLRTRGLKL